MKKLSFLVALVITCSLVFAFSVNPSMDGSAVVADNGVFPPGGYYGRAPGYLPGDTVIVTNHSNLMCRLKPVIFIFLLFFL